MKIFRIFGAAAASLCSLALSALSLQVTPGTLGASLSEALQGDSLSTVSSLTLSGAIDIRDFDTLRELTGLRQLDLSQASVAAYAGEPTASGRIEAAADTLPEYALMGVPATEIQLPSTLKGIDTGALADTRATSLVIPAGVTTIATGALASNPNLTSITLPASLTSLAPKAFQGCEKLATVTIQGPVTEIPELAFADCPELSSITLPASVATIGSEAFRGCTKLRNLSLPQQLQTIGAHAFAACGLEAADMASCSSLTTIGPWAFADCPRLATVAFPENLTTLGEGAFYVAPELQLQLGQLANTGVTTIPDFAFTNALQALATAFETTNITDLGRYALSGWEAVDSIALPVTLEQLSDFAMAQMQSLEYIQADTLTLVPALGDSVWAGIDPQLVTLNVAEDMFTPFTQSPQWQDFNVVFVRRSATTGVEEDLADSYGITARFDGDILRVEAPQALTEVLLADIQGRSYRLPFAEGDTSLSFDTAPLASPVFIVSVATTATPRPAIFKLAR